MTLEPQLLKKTDIKVVTTLPYFKVFSDNLNKLCQKITWFEFDPKNPSLNAPDLHSFWMISLETGMQYNE